MLDKMTDPAGAIYALYATRLITRSDVIAWADNRINNCDSPDIHLLDLSTCLNVDDNDILKCLGHLSTNDSDIQIGNAVLAKLRDMINEKRIALSDLYHPLFDLTVIGTIGRKANAKIIHFMYLLEAANEGFGLPLDIETALRELS